MEYCHTDGHQWKFTNEPEGAVYLQLKMKDYFKNFKFNLLSISAERHRFEPQILYTNVASVVYLLIHFYLFSLINFDPTSLFAL